MKKNFKKLGLKILAGLLLCSCAQGGKTLAMDAPNGNPEEKPLSRQYKKLLKKQREKEERKIGRIMREGKSAEKSIVVNLNARDLTATVFYKNSTIPPARIDFFSDEVEQLPLISNSNKCFPNRNWRRNDLSQTVRASQSNFSDETTVIAWINNMITAYGPMLLEFTTGVKAVVKKDNLQNLVCKNLQTAMA